MKDSILTPCYVSIPMPRPRPSIPMCQLMGLLQQVPIKHRNECEVCTTEETSFQRSQIVMQRLACERQVWEHGEPLNRCLS